MPSSTAKKYMKRVENTGHLLCPGCDQPMEYHVSRYGPYYRCCDWPACDFTVGCHPGTTEPLGVPADGQTRRLRVEAHDLFDQIWQRGFLTRNAAYIWMAKHMGLEEEYAHIGMFTAGQCQTLIRLCLRYLREKGEHDGRV